MSRSTDRGVRAAVVLAAVALAAGSWTSHAVTPPVNVVKAKRAAAAPARPRFGFGTIATPQEIAGWDIDVRPDGKGLPPGRGTVAQGQLIYDTQCASCHGTFGESNDCMALTGGVGTLASDQPQRTTISKLNHATTLWDYINRAMPFHAPQSLAVDEVYAVTAYVLHLGDLLPADGGLDRDRLIAIRMPNRDGFTREHGFGTVSARPDTANVACMRNCASAVTITSDYPEHARNLYGDLAEQMRGIGPFGGSRSVNAAASGPKHAPATEHGGDAAARIATTCHGTTGKVSGSALQDIGSGPAAAGGAKASVE